MNARFGRSLRPLWGLTPNAALLNHGSFGACPLDVLREQDRLRADMESQPDVFFRERIIPRDHETPLRAAAGALAAFVNAPTNAIAFTENATAGIQAALRSVAFAPGDRIMITNHTYNAMRLMVDARCAETGATPLVVQIPMPTSPAEVLARITAALTPTVKLAVIDHITSPTALVLPLKEMLAALRENGTRVIVDGAHSVGQIPLDLTDLRPDWYVSNAHKWLFAPKGTAFLYASPDVAPMTRPNVVSHFVGLGFPQSFDHTGTRDNTAWLCLPALVAFFESLGPEAVRTYQKKMIARVSDLLIPLGAIPVSGIEMCAAMRSFILPQRNAAEPQDAMTLMTNLWKNDRVQIAANVFGGKLLLRVSAQVYTNEDDLNQLRDALDRGGWPGR